MLRVLRCAVALKDSSALFRHDVCFCLGQRQEAAAIGVLTAVLNDAKEHPMSVAKGGTGNEHSHANKRPQGLTMQPLAVHGVQGATRGWRGAGSNWKAGMPCAAAAARR